MIKSELSVPEDLKELIVNFINKNQIVNFKR
jgi:hypothetical protein